MTEIEQRSPITGDLSRREPHSVVCPFSRIAPSRSLNLSVEVMEVFQLPDFGNIDLGVFRDFIYVTVPSGQSTYTDSLRGLSLTSQIVPSCSCPSHANTLANQGRTAVTPVNQRRGSMGWKAQ